jgi:hypothetical protein
MPQSHDATKPHIVHHEDSICPISSGASIVATQGGILFVGDSSGDEDKDDVSADENSPKGSGGEEISSDDEDLDPVTIAPLNKVRTRVLHISRVHPSNYWLCRHCLLGLKANKLQTGAPKRAALA